MQHFRDILKIGNFWRWGLFFLLLLTTVSCRNGNVRTVVVTRIVVENGQEIVVTRLIRQTVQVPATLPPTEQGQAEVILDLAYAGGEEVPDPQQVIERNGVDMVENLFIGLTRYDYATNTVMPALATSWEVSGDGLAWTFHLRNDVAWVRSALQAPPGVAREDARPELYRPVVAGDVVYAIRRACDHRTQTPNVFVFFIIAGCESYYALDEPIPSDQGLVQAEAVNDQTLVIHLVRPAAYFATITTGVAFRPVPGELIEFPALNGLPWTDLTNIVTNGPYLYGLDTIANTRTVLERNPFWPMTYAGNVEKVNIFWLDRPAGYQLWLDKGVDIAPLPAGEMENVMDVPLLSSRLRLIPEQAVFYLAYNFDSPVFQEAAVRRAFGAAINRVALIEDVYDGYGLPMRHFSPPGVLGAPPVNEVGIGYNSDLARLSMADSSFRDCRFMPPIRYMAHSTDLALFHAQTLRDMWEAELGCAENQIQIEQVEFGTLLANTRRDAGLIRPDVWDLAWASYYPDAHNWLFDVLHCTESENRQDRPCSEVDDILQTAANELDVLARWDLYRQAERLFFGEDGLAPLTPLFTRARFVMVQPWLTYTPATAGGEQFDTYFVDAQAKKLERLQ